MMNMLERSRDKYLYIFARQAKANLMRFAFLSYSCDPGGRGGIVGRKVSSRKLKFFDGVRFYFFGKLRYLLASIMQF
jgi:hypothetical protein